MWWTQCECAEQEPEAAPGHVYMNHIYFTYISLWEGLVIGGLFDLGAPPALIGVVAVGLVIVGAIPFNVYKRRILGGHQLLAQD
jgi:hypothetical protein